MENSKTNQTEIEKQILKELQEIRKKMEENISVGDYLTREQTMIFLGYKKTTMRELEKSEKLTPATLGRKKFYLKKQIIELLNKNIGLQNGQINWPENFNRVILPKINIDFFIQV